MFRIPASILVSVFVSATATAQLSVVGTSPTLHANNVAANATIAIDFDRPLAPASIPPATNDATAFGSISGPLGGTWSLENGDTRLRFTPARRFAAGEVVMVGLDHDLRAADNTTLRSAGYAFRFRIVTAPAPMAWTQIADVLLRQNPNVSVRIYGGNAHDLNRDGWADLPLACEDACDVRVLLNRADGTGQPQSLLLPTNPVGCTPSPNEPSDFDGDGLSDIVTCNVGGNVSVLPGNGDGSFDPSTSYPVGSAPAGLAVLDCDGDGDMDIATANNGSDNIALLRNNGNGTFAPATFFDSTGFQEYALSAADMNNDGITDLVVGVQFQGRVIVMLGNGNGTYSFASSTLAGGSVWMIVTGDVNNDGNIDVSTANGVSSSGSMLLGNGAGGLGAPQVVTMAGQAVATDLGDLDGDGDLDWVVSSFGGSEWRVFRNNGSGVFAFHTQFPAISNSACAVLYDFDGDRDLDLVLLDEIADHATYFRNGTPAGTPMCSGDGSIGACPCGNNGGTGRGCANSVNAQGALLTIAGQSNPDTAVLLATGMPVTATTIFLRGSAVEPTPVLFHDGLRCAGGALVRFGTQTASAGTSSYPGSAANTLSNVSGTVAGSGVTFWYQAFYRNAAAAFCPPATANVTNGIVVTW
ncbi:MAG: VCBS repeat-containing protein [Planctomycetes bacterium]|nr:VCBS repeat-containing protein [Planctomycetota bacterium]